MNNPHWLGIRVPMNNPHWFGYQTIKVPPIGWVSKSIHSQIVHNHIYEIIVSNKNISYSSMYMKIIYSILKYICNNPLFEISDTIEINIICIKVKT